MGYYPFFHTQYVLLVYVLEVLHITSLLQPFKKNARYLDILKQYKYHYYYYQSVLFTLITFLQVDLFFVSYFS